MSQTFSLELEPTQPLTIRHELLVVRAAYERTPTPTLRRKLAALLTFNDEMLAVTELLAGKDDLTPREEIFLGQAWLALETPDGDERAYAAASRAMSRSDEPEARANALALRAKAETRLGNINAARLTLPESLALDPHNKDACKRAAAIALAEKDSATVLSLYADLAQRGAAHSRLFAAQALAHAQRGEIDAARDIIGADQFFSAEKLLPPQGWPSIESFNAALADELVTHPELRFNRYGAASESSWRIDTMPNAAAPLARVLIESISEAIGQHVARFAASRHPWAAARPDTALLRSWCDRGERRLRELACAPVRVAKRRLLRARARSDRERQNPGRLHRVRPSGRSRGRSGGRGVWHADYPSGQRAIAAVSIAYLPSHISAWPPRSAHLRGVRCQTCVERTTHAGPVKPARNPSLRIAEGLLWSPRRVASQVVLLAVAGTISG